MKIKANLRILENANKLIESIACGIARLKESEQAMGGKPTIILGRNIEFGHNLHLNVWLTQTQSLLLLSKDNSDSVR